MNDVAPDAASHTYRPLLAVARAALNAHTRGWPYTPPQLGDVLDRPRGTFVTLRRNADGTLRGCIGHLTPTQPRLPDEVAACAVAAATRDPRFPPIDDPAEVDELRVEVSVLGTAEPVASSSELDPRRFGLIVRSGLRQGVLLPEIDGIERAEQQLEICRRKAGIEPDEPVELQRFPSFKVAE